MGRGEGRRFTAGGEEEEQEAREEARSVEGSRAERLPFMLLLLLLLMLLLPECRNAEPLLPFVVGGTTACGPGPFGGRMVVRKRWDPLPAAAAAAAAATAASEEEEDR